MKIGVFSDAHGIVGGYEDGRSLLLSRGAEELYFLGDAIGYTAGTAIIDQLMTHPEIVALAGNHEAMLLAGLQKLPLERASVYQFPRIDAALTSEQRAWLVSLPFEHIQCIDGVNLHFVHGSPADPTFGYVYPDTILSKEMAGMADVIFMGNTHRPFVRELDGKQFINVGSCGLSRDEDPRGCVCLFDTITRHAQLLRFSISEASRAALADSSVHPSVRHYLKLQAICTDISHDQ